MSSNSAPKKQHSSSQGLGDRGAHHQSAITPGRYPSEDARSYPKGKPLPSVPQGRDEVYPQSSNTRPQAQRLLSTMSPEDGTNRLPSTDHSRYGDRGQRESTVGYSGSSRYEKDRHSSRSKPNEGRY